VLLLVHEFDKLEYKPRTRITQIDYFVREEDFPARLVDVAFFACCGEFDVCYLMDQSGLLRTVYNVAHPACLSPIIGARVAPSTGKARGATPS
jgi:hypothetical protein